jgi:4-alpha-glucanotransferase
MGEPRYGTPLWFVREGSADGLWNPCRIVLEDGQDLGELSSLPSDLPLGYHWLIPRDGGPATKLIVHPTHCPEMPDAWGLAVQTYSLWTERSWGIGDLGDLDALARALHEAGGSAILISPLHQPAPSSPQQGSPYYASSRRALNPLMLAMHGPVPGPLRCAPGALIDRDAVWAAKREILEHEFDTLPADAQRPEPGTIAMWNALCDEHGPHWRSWPEPIRRYDAATLTGRLTTDPEFARRARFHEWCQTQIAEQLAGAAARGVDIIGDLAVGFSPDGADAWEYQELLALDVRIGAPPDLFNTAGQDWGIPPFVPWKLRAAGYQPFVDTIRAALDGVHALRVDHVMGLFRQYWVPDGVSAREGAYVTYPADELLAIIAIEATRAGAYVVGEDLGTVEPAVRERLAEHRIAGTKVLWFEEDPPSTWPPECLATITTHDLPTIAGVLAGNDGDDVLYARIEAIAPAGSVDATIQLVHDALLASPARLRLVTVDDICASTERPNRPGTVDGPNWRRLLPLPADRIPMPEPPARG